MPVDDDMSEPLPPSSEDRLTERIVRLLPELERHVRTRMGPELRSRESVSDIVQSTAREFLRSPHFEDRGEQGLRAWLKLAAEHKIRNRLRYWRASRRAGGEALAVRGEEVEQSGEAWPSREVLQTEESGVLAAAIERLSPEHAFVVRRVQFEGAAYGDVARELRRTSEAVRKLHARALGKLSTLLRG